MVLLYCTQNIQINALKGSCIRCYLARAWHLDNFRAAAVGNGAGPPDFLVIFSRVSHVIVNT